MKNKISNTIRLIFPYKKVNLFVVMLFFLGIIFGALFAGIIDVNDRNLVIEKINFFITSINKNSLNLLSTFKNSLTINFVYLFFIWISGMTIIGILLNFIVLFFKGFIIGFSLASFIVTFSYKGLIISSLYLIFSQLLNIIIVCTITIYSFIFSYKLLQVIFKNKNYELKKFLKSYTVILIMLIVVSIISSLSETILFPSLVKLVIKLFL